MSASRRAEPQRSPTGPEVANGFQTSRPNRLAGEDSWKPEVPEDAEVAEPGHRGDAVPCEGEHDERVRAADRCVRVWEVDAEGGLSVGSCGDEPERCAAADCSVAQERSDCRMALVLVGLRRHS